MIHREGTPTQMQPETQPAPQILLDATLASIRDAVLTTNLDGKVLTLNAAAVALTGWSRAEAIGQPVEAVLNLREYGTDNPQPNPVYTALREHRNVETTGQSLLVGKDGRRIGMHLSAKPLFASQANLNDPAAASLLGCLVIFHDASEALRLAERMSYLAQHDPLTGLPNRILLVDRLEQATRVADRTSDQLAVIFLDLDHFHQVNETAGNLVADQMLREVAYRLCDALRESDTVSRLGADEFVILLRGVPSYSSAEALAKKLLREISTPYFLSEKSVTVTCSIGISLYPRDASDAETLMHMADGAMHRAKQAGRNRYQFAQPEPIHSSQTPAEYGSKLTS